MPQSLPLPRPVEVTTPTSVYREQVSRLRGMTADEFASVDPFLAAEFVRVRVAHKVVRTV